MSCDVCTSYICYQLTNAHSMYIFGRACMHDKFPQHITAEGGAESIVYLQQYMPHSHAECSQDATIYNTLFSYHNL